VINSTRESGHDRFTFQAATARARKNKKKTKSKKKSLTDYPISNEIHSPFACDIFNSFQLLKKVKLELNSKKITSRNPHLNLEGGLLYILPLGDSNCNPTSSTSFFFFFCVLCFFLFHADATTRTLPSLFDSLPYSTGSAATFQAVSRPGSQAPRGDHSTRPSDSHT
jgi:hypothetical protein